VLFEGAGALEAPVYDREKLSQGNIIAGPAIIEEIASTTVVEPGDTVTVNGFGHLIMQLNSAP
jgi:N-methylhydantoinase A